MCHLLSFRGAEPSGSPSLFVNFFLVLFGGCDVQYQNAVPPTYHKSKHTTKDRVVLGAGMTVTLGMEIEHVAKDIQVAQ